MEHYCVAISRTRAQKLNCLIKFAFAIYLTDIVPTAIFSYTRSSPKRHTMRMQCTAEPLIAVDVCGFIAWTTILCTAAVTGRFVYTRHARLDEPMNDRTNVGANGWGNIRKFISVRIV